MGKINKALDYNKLLEEQSKGKQLKKILQFPLFAPIKYDGNYVVVTVFLGKVTFTTSGGLNYKHTDKHPFMMVSDGIYLAERIHGKGLLGDRNRCNLRGPKTDQTSTGHTYRVFDYLTHEDYVRSKSLYTYVERHEELHKTNVDKSLIVELPIIHNEEEFNAELKRVVKLGYEGIMGVNPDWIWQHHKTTRRINFIKFKGRPTVDLICVGWKEGTGKYEGLIGSLLMEDSEGRQVYVGSGMSDDDRHKSPNYFDGKVCEIEYEQIVYTYIQATHPPLNEGVLIRQSKTKEDID